MLFGFSCFLGREFVVLDFVVRLSNFHCCSSSDLPD